MAECPTNKSTSHAVKVMTLASFPILLLLAAVTAPHAYGWSHQAYRICTSSCHRHRRRDRPASSAFGSINSNINIVEGLGCDNTAAALPTTALRLHISRADLLRSGTTAASVSAAAALLLTTPSTARAAATGKVDPPPQDAAAAALRSGLDSLEKEKNKMDKVVKKKTKEVKKEIKKVDKTVKKETKKIDKTVKKEIKKIDKTVKKETKKIDKTVKKETEKARKEVDKGAKVIEREAKKIGDAVGKGTNSLVGVGDGGISSPPRSVGIDISRLKTCDDPRGKCLR